MRALTVGELIEELSKYDPNLIPVVCREGKDHFYCIDDEYEFTVMEDGVYYPYKPPENDGPALWIAST